jgi:hypothetical protein
VCSYEKRILSALQPAKTWTLCLISAISPFSLERCDSTIGSRIGWPDIKVFDIEESGARPGVHHGEGESGGGDDWALSCWWASHSGSESETWVVLEDVWQGIGIGRAVKMRQHFCSEVE